MFNICAISYSRDTYGAPSAPIVDKYPSSPQVVWEEPYYARKFEVLYAEFGPCNQ